MTPAPVPVPSPTPAAGPQAELDTILAVCRERGVDAYATFCAVLAGFAESDLDSTAKHKTDDTWGVFQQNPRWWPSAKQGTRAQCHAFLDKFGEIRRNGSYVVDCWQVQNWTVKGAPTPWTDMAGFLALANTRNYTRRIDQVAQMIRTGKVQ